RRGGGEPARGGELLRQPALRLAEAWPALHRQGPPPRRLRGRAAQLPRQAIAARSLRRREGEGVLAPALGRLDSACALRGAPPLRPGDPLAPGEAGGSPPRLPPDRCVVPGPAPLHLPELALER